MRLKPGQSLGLLISYYRRLVGHSRRLKRVHEKLDSRRILPSQATELVGPARDTDAFVVLVV